MRLQSNMKPWFGDSTTALYHGDSLQVLRCLPSNSVQCVVTSPPYFGLRDYGVPGQIGLEQTLDEYITTLVTVCSEVRRVLRSDGVMFLNIGDSYAGSWCEQGRPQGNGEMNGRSVASARQIAAHPKFTGMTGVRGKEKGIKAKDLMGVPWELAFSLRSSGWYLRSEIIWSKRSPMPESVRDRPTKAHEQVFVLSKSQRYFWDVVGSQESASGKWSGGSRQKYIEDQHFRTKTGLDSIPPVTTRNMRSVWSLSSYPLKSAHFAAFPPELVRRCLTAGVSEKGCCSKCGKPWQRIVEKHRVPTRPGTNSKINRASVHDVSPYESQAGSVVGNRDARRHVTEVVTTGWHPACKCDPLADGCNESLNGGYLPEPCTVLDPFHGAGTTWKVCQRLGLKYIGIELNEEYLKLSVERPPVHFPHEKRRSSRAAKANQKDPDQMELF